MKKELATGRQTKRKGETEKIVAVSEEEKRETNKGENRRQKKRQREGAINRKIKRATQRGRER